MTEIFWFIPGLILGAGLILIYNYIKRKDAKEIAQELVNQAETQKNKDLEILLNQVKDSFGALSLDALGKNTNEFLKLAKESLEKQTKEGEKDLESKKKLIDQTLQTMKGDLVKVEDLVLNLEKDREKKFGELTNQLKFTAEQTGKLQETTNQLHSALASTKVRGQWGERMAEDVLKMAGFIEGINYLKQKSMDSSQSRPDYTFLLPQNLKLNMDVKFPLDNYMHYLETEAESDRAKYKSQFLKDVRNRIKEVTTRDYINPEENTVDYMIVFIPNEQVYGFINENDRTLLDDALKTKVILCSPITLYAILAVIRQGVENFNLEKTAAQILSLLGTFNKQWEAFQESMDKMGKKIDDAQEEFTKLTTTRKKQLEKPLQKIEELRKQKEISVSDGEENNLLEI
ncbi:MAG: DNA recombination protein RmuC [Calditrichia bacterium]|nr:DNA recombination protein RmuC [Calditrichia bacterium]